jgi:CHRD domain
MNMRAILAGALLSAALSAGALAANQMYMADLKGSQENPPNDSKGTGMAELTYDPATGNLSWKVTYSGLSGAATAAHVHGPADPGKDGPVVIKFENPASPIQGSAKLTDAQAKDLEAGKLYINVHTPEHKSGEIRGQIEPAK